MLITLLSAKGSPGVTTTAAALAAAASPQLDTLVVEVDPSGGDIEVLTGVTGEPGLLRVANDLRRNVEAEVLPAYAVAAPAGVPAILAPTSAPATASVVTSVADRLGSALRTLPGAVLADAGRWDPAQPSAGRIAGADVVAIVCRPTALSVEHARHLLDRIREVTRPVVVVLVGDRPYGAGEIASVLETPVAGVIAWDPGGVAALWAEGVTRRWAKSWLARSARATHDSLLEVVAPVEVRR